MIDTREIMSDEEALEILSRHMGDKRPIRAVIDEFAKRAGVSGRRVDGCVNPPGEAEYNFSKCEKRHSTCRPATLYIHDAPKPSAEERIVRALAFHRDMTESGCSCKQCRILRGEE